MYNKQNLMMRPVVQSLMNDSFFSDFPEHFFSTRMHLTPLTNVKETADSFQLEIAAPGFEKTDFKLSVEGKNLNISANHEVNKENATGDKWIRKEFSKRSVRRSFQLPGDVDHDKISATYNNGILHVSIPKKKHEENQSGKSIEVL
jgi:HSP20 family protein